jgi:hypothetical protein
MGQMRDAYKMLVSKLEGSKPLVKPRSRWEDTIKMNRQEIYYSGYRLDSIQDRDQ